MLLLAEIESVAKEQSRKEYVLGACGTNRVEIILILLTEVITFHIRVPVAEVGVYGLKNSI